ncbi:hypothetical protein [Ochrobactrum chromiisoli]|uniref:Uncharacterized protein n=1 Tax=Ochrobactrum chromiisoli TaxID=2993941 RepID=A0ABT3QKU9_9HYPH|nr:hypothetical protein [Ochrobactrum chromiisoli]MCX2696240.1 hypothetical protein [Ochrobactrum chromiisoli]
MTIPVVKTAIAPNGGMPAHPAPSAVSMNVSQISVDIASPADHTVAHSTTLIQIYATSDILFYTDKSGEPFTPDFGMPLTAGAYFSFSVDAGCTLHFSAEKSALVYILEG